MTNRKPQRKPITCPVCGGHAHRDTRPRVVAYKDASITIDQPAWYCDACDEAVMTGADSNLASEFFDLLRSKVDATLSSVAVKAVRESLGLSQRRASLLLGGGRNAFQKYESGETHVSAAMARLLIAIYRRPDILEDLQAPPDDIMEFVRKKATPRLRRILDQVTKAVETKTA